MWRNYFNVTVRNLKRHPLFSIINISGLTIGLALCMLIVLYLKDERSFDQFHANKERIYRVVRENTRDKVYKDGNTGMVQGPAFAAAVPEIEKYVRVQSAMVTIKVGKEVFEQEGLFADSNFFSFFSFPMKYGNPKTALNDEHAVIFSEEVAKKLFGSTDVLGRTVELPFGENGSFIPFQVSGIVPKSPMNSSLDVTMLLPIRLSGMNDEEFGWINFYLNTFIQLSPGTSPSTVVPKLQRIYETSAKEQLRKIKEQYNEEVKITYALQPLAQLHLDTEYVADNGLVRNSKPIYGNILGGIALFILLIACINFINLTLARSLKRAKEIGIRKVVGGARSQIIIQFLGETVVLCLLAFLLATVLVMLLLPVFNSLSGKSLAFSYLLDARLVLLYFALFLGTSVLAGAYPAFILSGFDPVKTLYNRVRFGGRNLLSHSLVVLQFAIAAFLIAATITIYRQFDHLTSMDLGYNDKNLVMLRTDRIKSDKLAVFKQELQKDPAILSIAGRQGGSWGTTANVNGEPMNFSLEVMDTSVFSTLQLPIVMGRNLGLPSDSTNSILVNEAFMRKAGWRDLENKQVDFFYDSIKYNVVGVVRDHHYESLFTGIEPQLFTMHPKYSYGELMIRIAPGSSGRALAHIQKVSKAMFPLTPFNYEFKELRNRKQYEVEEKFRKIVTYASILAIFISCIGLFGLANLAAEKRTKEIGIRKVLGASVISISSKLSLRFLQLVMVAVVIAVPVAWYALNKWLDNYPYRIEVGPWVFVITVLMLVVIALLTIGYQAVRAARANPVRSLRSE